MKQGFYLFLFFNDRICNFKTFDSDFYPSPNGRRTKKKLSRKNKRVKKGRKNKRKHRKHRKNTKDKVAQTKALLRRKQSDHDRLTPIDDVFEVNMEAIRQTILTTNKYNYLAV